MVRGFSTPRHNHHHRRGQLQPTKTRRPCHRRCRRRRRRRRRQPYRYQPYRYRRRYRQPPRPTTLLLVLLPSPLLFPHSRPTLLPDDFEPSDKATITHSYVVKAISHDIANRARSVAEGASASSTSCGSTLAVATFVFGLTMGAFAVQRRKAVQGQGYETVADETTGVKMMQMSA